MNLRKFLMRFRLKVQLRENEITMGKAFVSYFLSPPGPFLSPPPLQHLSVDIFISQLFQRTRQQLYFHFLLCFAIFSCSKRAASGKASEWIGLRGVCSGELNFNLSRVIRALRVPPAMTGFIWDRLAWAEAREQSVIREINNFLLTLANSVGFCAVFSLGLLLVCLPIWFAFLIYPMMPCTCQPRIFKLNFPASLFAL